MKLTDRKRQQIVLGAVAEFRENGFAGTSMDSVAQRAEVSKRTVYNHFSSKDELFFGIVEYMFSLMAETSPQPYQKDIPLEQQLTYMAKAKMTLFASHEFLDLSRVTVPEAILHPEKLQHAMAQMNEIESRMEKWFASAIEDQQLKFSDASDACEQFMGLIKANAFWPRLLKGKPAPTEKEQAEIIERAVGMYLSYWKK